HEPSVAVIVDGMLVAAAEEERFTRVKHGKESHVDNADELPWRALEYCLEAAGVNAGEVDYVGYSFDPWRRFNHRWCDQGTASILSGDFGTPTGEREFLDSNLRARDELNLYMSRAKFCFLPHHVCHAASSFLVSPFEEAGILVADGIA